MFPCSKLRSGPVFSPRSPIKALFWLRSCSQTIFHAADLASRTGPGIRLGGPSFQKIKQPLRNPPVFAANFPQLCVAQFFLTLLCSAVYSIAVRGAGTSRQIVYSFSLGRTPHG